MTHPDTLHFPDIREAFPRSARPIGTIVVDAEEDFNWLNPIYGTTHSVSNMLSICTLHEIARSYGAVPTYLLTYPILDEPDIVRMLCRLRDREQCDLGVQLHPWVTPPFNQDKVTRGSETSFAGRLPKDQEEQKLSALIVKFRDCFGFSPTMYRAGRYGLGRHTPAILEQMGFLIDTSVAPRTDFSLEGGPDYTSFPYRPFWFGRNTSLFEAPLCREVVGWTGTLSPMLYQALTGQIPKRLRIAAMAALTRSAERITLSPEGNDFLAMARLCRALQSTDRQLYSVSFHSSSLVMGRNPYVTTKSDLHRFYDRLSEILSFLVESLGVCFYRLVDIPHEFHKVGPA